jgi:hypothetical protein
MNINEMISELKSIRAGRQTRVWGPFLLKYHLDVICEIGVQNGVNFKNLIAHDPRIAVAVDSWINDGTTARNDGLYSQEELDRQYNSFKNQMADKPFVRIYREYSFEAVKHFEDYYFDFVYIDADHTYEGCKRDIVDWYPKVKIGGILCGHDYVHRNYVVRFGVIEAINEFVKEKGIKTFFTLPKGVWGIIKI